MRRLLIFGNSGSGKSFLARQLSAKLCAPCHHLDELFWKTGGCTEKRPKEEVHAELDRLRSSASWIIEGTFGDLIERCAPDANLIVFLDLPWPECEQNLRTRGYEPEKWADKELGNSKFENLVLWAKEYWSRSDRFSHLYHNKIFASFAGEKVRICSRLQMNELEFKWKL